MTSALAIVIAFLVDHFFREPPARFHPVVWIGRMLAVTGAPWRHAAPHTAFARGAAAWIVGAAVSSGLAWGAAEVIRVAVGTPSAPSVLVHGALVGLLLKPLLAWRMLTDEVSDVERALAAGVESGRTQLKRLVSRDTSRLNAAEVRESALESLAENLNDSLIAALFWFCVGGLPGAAVYRFANTADAMWGCHGEWEWAGKWAARADDALSYIPARLTAALLAVSAWHWPARLGEVARVTPSPNGGWPMGMLALALNVRLGKPGVYVLNPAGDVPGPAHVREGLRIGQRTAWLSVLISAATAWMVTQWR